MEDGRARSLPTSTADFKTLQGLSTARKLPQSPVAVSSSCPLGPHCLPSCWHLGMPTIETQSPVYVHTCTYTHIHTVPRTTDLYSQPVGTWILLSPQTQTHLQKCLAFSQPRHIALTVDDSVSMVSRKLTWTSWPIQQNNLLILWSHQCLLAQTCDCSSTWLPDLSSYLSASPA